MNAESQWLSELGQQAVREFHQEPADGSEEDVSQLIRARVEQRRVLRSTVCVLSVLVCVALTSWYQFKLDWEMSQTNWPAYTQYQQIQIGSVQ